MISKTDDYADMLIPVKLLDETMKPYELSNLVLEEYFKATKRFGSFKSAHEGYAVLLEEVDELWEEVKKKKGKRKTKKMLEEAIQIAAMAIRFAHDICGEAI